jgi:peptidoglycan/LPS O-acetylase OafA/YrhL
MKNATQPGSNPEYKPDFWPSLASRFENSQSIDAYTSSIKGFTSGFDYLRFLLSLSVLIWHSYVVVVGLSPALGVAKEWSGYITWWILPMFFSLSGFLVAASLNRTPTIRKFLWLRLIRIYPALTVEVLLSAFILGALITTVPLKQYFLDPLFFQYLLNTIGWIHYELPGVFTDNPFSNIVNTSLSTVPAELKCYILIASLAFLTLTKKPRLLLSLFVAATIVVTMASFVVEFPGRFPANARSPHLVSFFIAGVLINLCKAFIPFSKGLFWASVLFGALFLYSDHYIFLASLPVAYVTVWLGLQQPKKIPVVMDGDYSYGIYLYAAPIQQAVWHWTEFGRTYAGNIILSIFFVSIFSVFSWHIIEKPMLKYKKYFG